MPTSYDTFFRTATGGNAPYGYQCRLACGEPSQISDPASEMREAPAPCSPQLISIPTGLGKTAAVVLAWLWNRLSEDPLLRGVAAGRGVAWPRRLVYCLPMRTLVEQTSGEIEKWLRNLRNAALDGKLSLSESALDELLWLAGTEGLSPTQISHLPAALKGKEAKPHSPVVLMGGEELDEARREWDIHPERPAILIGTQDMLLSRALNRGYGMSRYRWPMHFGLLNNDCLWVMDETQLMGVSVETSAQLAGFRTRWPGLGECPTWWMSATLEDARLATVDHPCPAKGWPREQLTTDEKERPGSRPAELFTAKKSVAPAMISVERLTLSAASKNGYEKLLAALVVDKHRPGTLTLVVVNRVSRAQKIYRALTSARKEGRQTLPPLYDPSRVALIHSRFRRGDREKHELLLFSDGDRIVIATQAVEAGVDVSARLLITELAPWSSLVQRFGRCNRRAEYPDAEILWIDIEPDAKGDLLRPYSENELQRAREALRPLADASPKTLCAVQVESEKIIRPVIRRRDLVDFFDTTPDLCGQDLDISRYIRDEQDNDVQLFWRDVGQDGPAPDTNPPHRAELCRVSLGDAKEFLNLKTKTIHAWCWSPLDEQWEKATFARPGAVYLIAATIGGYSEAHGWTGDVADKPTSLPPAVGKSDHYGGDRQTFDRDWQTLAAHTADVVAEMQRITAAFALKDSSSEATALLTAAHWHDVGKAHPHFQAALRDGPHKPVNPDECYAKSKNPPKPRRGDTPYRSLRHELASALVWLLRSAPEALNPGRDLIAYLIAAHHGKVRLSIRSLPDEKGPPAPSPENPETLFARGIWHGDKLPALAIDGLALPETTLDLRFMHMGESDLGPSWLARTIALRDSHGPFRLAFLETLLRAADARASQTPTMHP